MFPITDKGEVASCRKGIDYEFGGFEVVHTSGRHEKDFGH